MAQNSVPISVLAGPNIGSDPTQSESVVGAATAWEALADPSDADYIHFEYDINSPTGSDVAGYDVTVECDSLVDPIIDTGHEIHVTLRFQATTSTPPEGISCFIELYAAISGSAVLIKRLDGSDPPQISPGDLDAAIGASFVTVAVGLTDVEAQAFRAAGGYGDFGFFIGAGAGDSSLQDHNVGEFDVAFIELEVPNPSGGGEQITGSGGLIFGGQGLGLAFFVPEGGFEFSGGGSSSIYFDPLEYDALGGLIFSGTSGPIGGNQFTGVGGFIFSGGGRQFIIRSPDIGGIYFLDFAATHDTYYLRDGDQGTEDVKIPDPFFKTAFLGD